MLFRSCDQCQFLGHFKEFDLYACGKEDDQFYFHVDTVIARRSDEGGDYSSGAAFSFIEDKEPSPLKVAMSRCIYRNFKFEPHVQREAWRFIIEPMFKKIAVETE